MSVSYGTAGRAAAPAPGDAVGVDEYREVAYVRDRGRPLELVSLKGKDAARPPCPMPGLDGAHRDGRGRARQDRVPLIGTADGRSIPLDMKFDVTFKDGRAHGDGRARSSARPPSLDPDKQAARAADQRRGGPNAGGVTVAQVGPTELVDPDR